MMYIASGVVKVVSTTFEGDEVTLAVRRKGDLVGDHSALAGSPRSASVVVVEAGEALIVPAPRFLELLEQHPEIAMAQLRRLLRLVQEADDRMVEVVTMRVGERVLSRIRSLTKEAEGDHLKLSQDELAGLCVASRGAVSIVLARLRDLGAIRTKRRSIEIVDRDLLESLDASLLDTP